MRKDWFSCRFSVAQCLFPAFSVTCRTNARPHRVAAHEEDRMHRLLDTGRARLRGRAVASAVAVGSMVIAGAMAPGTAFAAHGAKPAAGPRQQHVFDSTGCALGNGVK